MKSASKFEKTAARCWNLLNEGKPFTPIFVVGTMTIFHFQGLLQGEWFSFLISLLFTLPLFILYFYYDFPLFLRNYLWIPVIGYLLLFESPDLALWGLGIGLYFFFTVFFWGTFYYHLRIGTDWLNFTRFWKLVLKNSDSTSGNAQEQLPKFLLLLSVWDGMMTNLSTGELLPTNDYFIFCGVVFALAFILHHFLFDWKPKQYDSFTAGEPGEALNDKVVVIVIDGMRKERFYEANTPFLDGLMEKGTEYLNMETVYPARTVVCFSSMFTGTYPKEHGMRSNMVWKLGIKVESIFDSLRKVGKKGKMLGIAHLVDSFGSDVDTVTAVMHKDKADRNIINKAKKIMEEEDPDLFIVQLIGTDQIGHSRGVLYNEYIEKIEEADRLIQEYVEWLEAEGKMENTTLMICADHGQADGIGGHGHLDEGERFVPFFMVGPGVKPGEKIQEKHSLVSMAPTIAHLLGAPFPGNSRGPVLNEALKESWKQHE
ncbi:MULTISPECIES: alkaline phosphatase family protein [Bacillaceae]|uniref:alkaline phosphatase family protein n=1 Tax=Bacillaceae TaxID=186817 RepID=UPI001C571F5F|nr:alkaline phosphatase family protein [Rossellomorea sp. YZS02]MBW3111795.1 alkaline phosphatase family protein [Bacillus sp. MCCB 382]MDX8342067.1 alkaline phosphatase family protein [Rossellomorea sp. YZS02]